MKKRILSLALVLCLVCTMLCSCGSDVADTASDDVVATDEATDVEYYEGTELQQLETFTSVTGIELNITEDAPESDSVIYNYLADNDAAGLGAVIKYESYLEDYGFEKSEELSSDDSTIYIKDGYVLVTGKFNPQDNVIQYIVSVPNSRAASEEEPEPTPEIVVTPTPEPEKDEAEIYAELCELVDEEKYGEAVSYQEKEKLSLDYADASDYINYATAMHLYTEQEVLTVDDLRSVVTTLSEDVSSDFKDAATTASQISSDLSRLIGTHCYKAWPALTGRTSTDSMFLVIQEDGSAQLEFGNSLTGETASNYFHDVLLYFNLEKGSCYGLTDSFYKDADHCTYCLYLFDEKKVTVLKAWANIDQGVFAGEYSDY